VLAEWVLQSQVGWGIGDVEGNGDDKVVVVIGIIVMVSQSLTRSVWEGSCPGFLACVTLHVMVPGGAQFKV